jgi:hypothetical protein
LKNNTLYQEEFPTGSENFDSTYFIYNKGKLKRFRKIERVDSIIWMNGGWSKHPIGGPHKFHGLDKHSEYQH